MADGVRPMLDDLARHGSAVRGQRGDETDQLERDARRVLRAPPPAAARGSRRQRGRRRRWRSAARRRTGSARAGGRNGDGWRTRRPPGCRAGPGHRRSRSARNRRCRDRPRSTRPLPAPRWCWSRPTRSAGPTRRRPPDSASAHPKADPEQARYRRVLRSVLPFFVRAVTVRRKAVAGTLRSVTTRRELAPAQLPHRLAVDGDPGGDELVAPRALGSRTRTGLRRVHVPAAGRRRPAPATGSSPAGAESVKASGRQGWLSTVSHAGWPFGTPAFGIVLTTSSEGCSASCRMLLTPPLASGWKFHPPVWLGVSMISADPRSGAEDVLEREHLDPHLRRLARLERLGV